VSVAGGRAPGLLPSLQAPAAEHPEMTMAAVAEHPSVDVPVIRVPWWSWLVVTLALLGSYLMLQENGFLLTQWETLHELFHDGRHALGFPCH
jgi:cobalt transporter subunit CbtB